MISRFAKKMLRLVPIVLVLTSGCTITPQLHIDQDRLAHIRSGDHGILEFRFMKNDFIPEYIPLGISSIRPYRDVKVDFRWWTFSLSVNGVMYYKHAAVSPDYIVEIPVKAGDLSIEYRLFAGGVGMTSNIDMFRIAYYSTEGMVTLHSDIQGEERIIFQMKKAGEIRYAHVDTGWGTRGDAQPVRFEEVSE